MSSALVVAIIAVVVIMSGLVALKAASGSLAGSTEPDSAVRDSGTGPIRFRVDPKPYFFSRAENAFFTQLLPIVAELDLMVFPKVGLNDFLKDSTDAEKGQYNRYAQMHVDYLLVSRKDYKPVAGIELDGSSHNGGKQAARDDKKKAVFKAAGIPLLRFANGAGAEEVRQKIEDVVGQRIS